MVQFTIELARSLHRPSRPNMATATMPIQSFLVPHKPPFSWFPSHPSRSATLKNTCGCKSIKICMALDDKVAHTEAPAELGEEKIHQGVSMQSRAVMRAARKEVERLTYLFAAIMSSLGISSLAVMSIYWRFSWQMKGGQVPFIEMFGTFALSVGAAVGMEFWARWAHRALWHASLWHMHQSHHRPRDGPFELNDVFAIINAVPAIALLSYGFYNKGIVPGLCFGAGLGITVYGMAYMFLHDGLVHRRFPVGPIANVPYLRRVAAAHQLHHSEKFKGVPYGLFLGPKELEDVGGKEELKKEIQRRKKALGRSIARI